MNLKDMIVPNKDFQTSVNIDFDFGSEEKVKGLIPTDAVCRYLEEIIRDVVSPSNHRAKLFVGAYGKGKSHVVLAALTAMWIKDPALFNHIVNAYNERGLGFGETLERFVAEGQRLLPVVVSGSTADLRHSLLNALRNALRANGLESLMPKTNYDGAQRVLDRWKASYPETMRRFEQLTGFGYSAFSARLRNLDTEAYDEFVAVYPKLTSGGTFDVLDSAEVLDVYENVLKCLKARGIAGIYVVYDEFSKYLETSIGKATVEDTRLLQDFAEACSRSGMSEQLHLLLISHKSLTNYIDADLPKEKVDGWRGVSGRFDEIEMFDDANQAYELMSAAIIKKEALWEKMLSARKGAFRNFLERAADRYRKRGLFDAEAASLVACGCYPLHPLTAYILPRLSEKVAQNERTLFTFLCATGKCTLGECLESANVFVTPDCVYDYFEPLLRREIYTSPLHKTYMLARAAIARVEDDALAIKIVKIIAAIDAVAQYDRLAPTRETIVELFGDCGVKAAEVDRALSRLVEGESVVYLRRSNALFKLKEATDVRIDAEVADRAEALRSSMTPVQILNASIRGKAVYPSRYNEERAIVRYFDCGFVDAAAIRSRKLGEPILHGGGDGEIVAIYCEIPDEEQELKQEAEDVLSCEPMTVVAFPRHFKRIDDALFRLEAARQLRAEAKDDVNLADEYEIVIEDYAEIVDGYIAGFFQPELLQSFYFINGEERREITRKRKLSEELSFLCDKTFGSTPRITSEALNKNELTGTAFSSRTKILKALCAPALAPNLGFVGNGQETSMARSALEKTGLVRNIDDGINDAGVLCANMADVIGVIEEFVRSASDATFQDLYDKLMGRELGIGMRKGPIPIYLALVLRRYKDEVKVTHDGEERPINEVLLDDIARNPGAYRITHLNWSPEMDAYLRALAEIFGCGQDRISRSVVAEEMRLWYVSLPQATRNCRIDHTHAGEGVCTSKERRAFFGAIKRIDVDTDVFLFERLPEVFGYPVGSVELIAAIAQEKSACDCYLAYCADGLAKALIALFDPNANDDVSLSSVLQDWVDAHPIARTRVFSGINNQVLGAVMLASGDDFVTVNRIAKAATALRMDDWNDNRFADFLRIVEGMKAEVESAKEEADDSLKDKVVISFTASDGTVTQKEFAPVEASKRSRLLKNEIVSCLSDMGAALSPEEKRQVVFEVLKGLC